MKKIRIFKTLNEYKNFLYSNIVTRPEFLMSPFYNGLINFIIDNRTPIFFEKSEGDEKAHFTAFFNFELLRDGYENPYIKDLYFIHDFIHMVFDNPINLGFKPFDEFCKQAIYNEYAAANETEIMTYYRLPKLRRKTFNFPILFDFIKTRYSKKPSTKFLFYFRKKVIEEGDFGFLKKSKKASESLRFLTKFKKNNEVWCKVWYKNFPKISEDYIKRRTSLSVLDYERYLENYVPLNSEEKYRENVLLNFQTAFKLQDYKNGPNTFEECFKAAETLNNNVILEKAAKKFDYQYRKTG